MDFLIDKIYNTYLRVSRTQKNKPFRYRKNFEDFEKEENYLPVLKLKSFFARNPQIKMEDFFLAPYYIFPDSKESYYDLKFYNSLQAIKTYSLFNKKLMMEDPDSDIQLSKIKEGLAFIKSFCIEKNIPLGQYLHYKSEKTHDFLIHLTEKNISLYNLFLLKDFEKVIRTYDFELLSFILKELASRISHYRSKFLASKKAKLLCSEGLKKIENIIKKNLENQNNTITI